MKVVDVVRSCRRRWYIVGFVMVSTAALCVFLLLSSGVYWARSQVIFLGPPVPTKPNKLDSSSAGLIATAGLIEREMNARRSRIPATSSDVLLIDQGIYDGEQVKLPNNGGQWSTNFNEPVLDIQASGKDSAVVQARMNNMIAEVETILARMQDDAGVRSSERISTTLAPPNVQVNFARGNRTRAAAIAALLGICLSVAAAVGVEAVGRRIRGWRFSRRVSLPVGGSAR